MAKRLGLGYLEKKIEELDRNIDLEGSDITVNSLTSDTGVTVTAGGVTVTAGNVAFRENHPIIKHQGNHATLADSAAVITHGNVKAQILECTPTAGRSKATDTAANYIANLGLTTNGDSVDFFIVNKSTTVTHIITITDGGSVTLSGAMTVDPYIAAEDTSGSAMFRLRRTGAAACRLYRLS